MTPNFFRRLFPILGCMWAGAVGEPGARATSFYERPFSESVQEAPEIVRGTPRRTYADWGAADNGERRLYTYIEVEPREMLKGALPTTPTLILREMGGEKDGVGMQIAGSAQFKLGEDAVIFMGHRNPDGSHDVWGLMMGKFEVQSDAQGHEGIVGPGLGSADASGHPRFYTLAALRDLVRDPGHPRSADSPQPEASGMPQTAPTAARPSPGSPAAHFPGSAPVRSARPASGDEPEPNAAPMTSSRGWIALASALVILALGIAWRKLRAPNRR